MIRHTGENASVAGWGRRFGLVAMVLTSAQCGLGKVEQVGPGPGDRQPGSGGVSGFDAGVPQGSGGAGGDDLSQCTAEDSGGIKPGFMEVTNLALPEQGQTATPPPPISGGTLIILRDGVTAVASDPDRDLVYVADFSNRDAPRLKSTITLTAHDEPGRLIEDGAGKVHVALRNSAALVTIDPSAGAITMRRAVCTAPRGLAYDATTDQLHVACANGQLSSYKPSGAAPLRTLNLGQDLRDVVVDGTRLLVSRFRSAQVLVVEADGSVGGRVSPVVFRSTFLGEQDDFDPSVAWRMVGKHGGGAAMVHQRGKHGRVDRRPGGYGSRGGSCDGIVHTAVSVVSADGTTPAAGPAMPGFVLPVDLALSEDGERLAIVAAGNGHLTAGAQRLFVTTTAEATAEWAGGCGNDGHHGPSGRGCTGVGGGGGRSGIDAGASATGGATAGGADAGIGGATTAPRTRDGSVAPPPVTCTDLPRDVEPTAVAFLDASTVVVQSREPARLWLVTLDGTATTSVTPLSLTDVSVGDLGHTMFHTNSGGGLACASCHPEGHEDGRVWNFACEGERRTQDIGGGLAGTEPFHWNGDLGNFSALVNTVFVGRMSGPQLTLEQSAAMMHWIDTVPTLPTMRDPAEAQVARGKAIFNDPKVACGSCHTGALLTNNTTVDVGTAGMFQVPALRGLAWRAPYMHNGCADTLEARFAPGSCGGGDAHGRTSQLTAAQRADLIAYLQSL